MIECVYLYNERFQTIDMTLESPLLKSCLWPSLLANSTFIFLPMVFIFGTIIAYHMCTTKKVSECEYDLGFKSQCLNYLYVSFAHNKHYPARGGNDCR